DLTGITPARWLMCSQAHVEPVLRAHAEAAGGELRYGEELESFEADPEGVTAVLCAAGSVERRTVRARYLAAADGARSSVRNRLGIATEELGPTSHRLALLFRAGVGEALRGRRIVICYVMNREVPGGVLMPVDDDGTWQLDVPYDPERETPEDFDD